MLKGRVFLMCFTLALSLGVAADGFGQAELAQAAPAQAPPTQAAPAQAPPAQAAPAQAPQQEEIRSGCLMTGTGVGTFVLVDEVTGMRLSVSGPSPDLAKYAGTSGSRVNLTGTLIRQGNMDVFMVTKVEQTRDSCGPIGFTPAGLKAEIGRARLGVRAGLAFDPELIVIGGQAQLGPIFRSIWFRPTGEFAFGEVTKVFSINADGVYYLPFFGQGPNQRTRWSTYAGAGPSWTILRRDFKGFPDNPVEFEDDWASEFGLNFFFGAIQSNGLFIELRASAYSTPDVRMYVGIVFH
jgi:hypothetical protein